MSHTRLSRSLFFSPVKQLLRRIAMKPELRPRIEAILGRLVLLTPSKAVVEGSIMYLAKDRVCIQMALSGTWEPRNTMLVRSVVREGDAVLDVGAHVGYYTLILSKLVGPRGHVYSFEPNPANFRLLKMNVEANGCKNVSLEQKALSDKAGPVFIADWTLVDKNDSKHQQSGGLDQIETVTLDGYFGTQIPDIAFMKIDIEGHEIHALKGASETINRGRSIKILTEFDPFRWSRDGVNPREFLDLLDRSGFSMSIVDRMKSDMEPISDFDDVLVRYGQMGNSLDLFCVRKSLS